MTSPSLERLLLAAMSAAPIVSAPALIAVACVS